MSAPPTTADRDALLEERDFLLASLDDLDREHAAGDIDDDDYHALKDDYTVRAAAVVRALDRYDAKALAADADRVGGGGPRGGRVRTLAISGLVVAFALVAGFVIAEVDLGKVAEARRMVPSLTHDRTYSAPVIHKAALAKAAE